MVNFTQLALHYNYIILLIYFLYKIILQLIQDLIKGIYYNY